LGIAAAKINQLKDDNMQLLTFFENRGMSKMKSQRKKQPDIHPHFSCNMRWIVEIEQS
jgi:hypothetical protein